MSTVREIMTPQQVAEYLQLTPDTIYRYIREGMLAASRFGRQYRIPKKNVDLLLLTTSTVGGARLRSFSRNEVNEWVEEDQIDEKTQATGKKLLEALK